MPNLVIPMGVPGCGKSTFGKTFFDLKYAILSPDAERKRRYGSLREAHKDPSHNNTIFTDLYEKCGEHLQHNVDVYWDATSVLREYRKPLLGMGRKHGATIIGILFDNTLEAVLRNNLRDEDAVVPGNVMERMIGNFDRTKVEVMQEDFDKIIRIGSVAGKTEHGISIVA